MSLPLDPIVMPQKFSRLLHPPELLLKFTSIKQGCKKFRDSGRRQWALVDRPAAQNAAKGKHGKYIWEASHWGKNQAENVHLIISLLSCFGSGISETRKNAAKEELLYIHFGCFPLLKLFRRCTVFHQKLISPSNYT